MTGSSTSAIGRHRAALPDHEAIVRIVDVSKAYGKDAPVVEGLDLDIRKGEFLTLLGPSGSGKTTTLMMLAGFEEPTSGTIEIGGRSVNGVPPYRRGIGVVFQHYALFPHMTVEENVGFPLLVRRKFSRAEIDAAVGKALELVRMDAYRRRKPRELSGGQQQRIALARAMVFQPELILMDEPLGALDLKLRQEIQLELKALHRNTSVTFVYVTHDQGEALTMSDRIAVFDKGRIQQLADPRTLYRRPANAFVAGFIGDNNLLSGIVREAGSGECVVDLGGRPVRMTTESDCRTGRTVEFTIRPEHIALHRDDGAGRVAGVVTETIYLGDQARTSLALADGQQLTVRTPPDDFAAHFEIGQPVFASWDERNCRAFGGGAA